MIIGRAGPWADKVKEAMVTGEKINLNGRLVRVLSREMIHKTNQNPLMIVNLEVFTPGDETLVTV